MLWVDLLMVQPIIACLHVFAIIWALALCSTQGESYNRKLTCFYWLSVIQVLTVIFLIKSTHSIFYIFRNMWNKRPPISRWECSTEPMTKFYNTKSQNETLLKSTWKKLHREETNNNSCIARFKLYIVDSIFMHKMMQRDV